MSNATTSIKKFFAECEQEPLSYSGAIQAYGALLHMNSRQEITHISRNFQEILALPQFEIGTRVPDFLIEFTKNLADEPNSREFFDEALEGQHYSLSLALVRTQTYGILFEFFPNQSKSLLSIQAPSQIYQSFSNWQQVSQARQVLIEWIAQTTGFDRVMYYQFLHDGDGEVIAEHTYSNYQGTYLGLRFPASDIPLIARQLYLLHPWRSIYNATQAPCPIEGHSLLDLSYSDLRSVSPVHATYMQNMGDVASFSLPIKLQDSLDAMISCHHTSAKTLPLADKVKIFHAVRQFNIQLRDFYTRQRVKTLDEMQHIYHRIFIEIQKITATDQAWEHLGQRLQTIFDSDAFILVGGSLSHPLSSCPIHPEFLQALDTWFTDQCDELITTSEHLQNTLGMEILTDFAGFCACKWHFLDSSDLYRIYLLRYEHLSDVYWGGNPNKPVEYHDGTLGIAPRRSFSLWIEKRLGYCKPWPENTQLKLLKLREFLKKQASFN
ncbi:PAS fold-containing protein [Allopseudospirillum japonicum]|uniref:PAS fold-containing protein n=1 Tax=Allopseudospirillum japonicum TaxID=64971 RepID=A0A1H6QDZ4_9GAMM|nr:GAF domain-containing protein [Allopseudospirillum japonicum]SEI37232.1 PAS fold-containing protein [Allopseudospirillum japonicum]